MSERETIEAAAEPLRAPQTVPQQAEAAAETQANDSSAGAKSALSPRRVARVVTAYQQREGAGFLVRRPIPTRGMESADPFLMLDELGPVQYGPGEAVGAPDHPHRGFETVTYLLEGEAEHEDSAGHKGLMRPGDVQWMTAGAGIVHSEMPSARFMETGGKWHGFQLWVNLPARAKGMAPRYQELPGAGIPTGVSADGRSRVKVLAGEALGVKAAIDTVTPIVYQHWTFQPGARGQLGVPQNMRAVVYVFQGQLRLGEEGQAVREGQLALLEGEGALTYRCEWPGGAQLLLLAGEPIGEPVAWYGPFVMNTEAEIRQAIHDYQGGRMGQIARSLPQAG